MMKKILLITGLLALLLLVGTACDRQQEAGLKSYTVTCTLDSDLQRDSATLLVLEEDYNKLRCCGAAHSQNGTFTFKGQISSPKVALIRWDNDSVHPFHFVLEPGNIRLSIKKGSWKVAGSKHNSDYLSFINWRNGIMNRRVATWQEYLKGAQNGSLTHEQEQRMVLQDSLLNDSLQRITVERINRGDAVGRIIRERFASQLDIDHARQLKR